VSPQSEHDVEARPILVTTNPEVIDKVSEPPLQMLYHIHAYTSSHPRLTESHSAYRFQPSILTSSSS
jgi:histidinol dehydrogenase